MQNVPLFSLIVPAYNEERRLPTTLRDIKSFFTKFDSNFEVIIVIEKSTDRTAELAYREIDTDQRFRVIENSTHRGKGYAVRTGMLQAQGQFVFFTDADLSTPLVEIIRFLTHFQENPDVDVLIGNRADALSKIAQAQHPIRRNMGRIFNRFVQLFAIRGVNDTQCGFKGFRAKPCKEIFSRQRIDGFAFDVEVLLLAHKLGYQFDSLPVYWRNSPDSKVSMIWDPLKMLWDLIRIRFMLVNVKRLDS